MSDAYILAAKFLLPVAACLGAAGLLGLACLIYQDCRAAQQQSDELQKHLDRQPIERPAAPDETAFARDFRNEFTRHRAQPQPFVSTPTHNT